MERQHCAALVYPHAFTFRKQCVGLPEHHSVIALVQMALHSVHIPRYGEVAVIVSAIHAIAVIPMVEVTADVAVDFLVHCNHHILCSLVNGSFIVGGDYIAVR